MTLLSLAAYAATHGASKQAAAKWKARGLLVFSGNKVDAEQSDARMRAHGLGRFKASTAPTTRDVNRQPDRQPVDASVDASVDAAIDEVVTDLAAAAADGEIDEEGAHEFVTALLSGRILTRAQAEEVKESGLALKQYLAAQKAAGAMVDIALAESVIFEDRRAARDAWLNWAGRIAPLVAAELGIEAAALVEALIPHVHQQLQDLGEPDLDFSGEGES